ncbi:extensin-1-like [Homarus americanus]|uniref:Pro-resilin-like 5 n=1 Tax=Homarus americanus TaxID=6706 RepID=A0A8J5TP05_HOMAM|nr:extensin-1-like [Homarus americanus]KAG7176298.1 Pro-resilin-like 5 [Homarus americanus]
MCSAMEGYSVPSLLLVLLLSSYLGECRGGPQQQYPPNDTTITVFRPSGAGSGYQFEYQVIEAGSSWSQSRGEWSDGVSTRGSYTVRLPDGRLQRVTYIADEHGFRPVITYEQLEGGVDGYDWQKKRMGKKVEGEIYGKKMKMDDGEKGHEEDKDRHSDMKMDHTAREIGKQVVSPVHSRFTEDPTAYAHVPQPYDSSWRGYNSHNSHPTRNYQAPPPGRPHHNTPSYHPPSPGHYGMKTSHPVHDRVEKYQENLSGHPKYMENIKSMILKHPAEKAKTYRINTAPPRHPPMELKDTNHEEMRKPTNGHAKAYKLVTEMKKSDKDEMFDKMKEVMMKEEDDMKKKDDGPLYRQDMGMSSKMEPHPYSSKMRANEQDEESSEVSSEMVSSEEDDDLLYRKMMTTMLPPSKPFVPSTYYPIMPTLAPSSRPPTTSHPSESTSPPSEDSLPHSPSKPSEAPHKMMSPMRESSPHAVPTSYHPYPVSLSSPYDPLSHYHYHSPLHPLPYLSYSSHPYTQPYLLPHRSYYKPSAPSPHHLSHIHSSSSHSPYSPTHSYSPPPFASHPPTPAYLHPLAEASEMIMESASGEEMH